MDATFLTPDTPLPDDVATLQAMVRELFTELAKSRAENAELKAELAKLRAENTALQTKLDAALKPRFGCRSEKRPPPPKPATDKPARRRDEHGRSAIPEHLQRRDVVHDLTEAAGGRISASNGDCAATRLSQARLSGARLSIELPVRKR